MPDIFPESRDEAILLSMINGEEYTGFPESRIEVLLLQLKATLEDWKSKTKGAYVFHGSVEFSELPSTLTEDMVGWTYNMLEEFTTDDRFVDGAGKVYPAGTNVAIANVGTDETPVLKFDVTSAFVDVNAIYDAIDKVADMIADEFDEDEAYAVGDIVWYMDDLYTFASAHTAGDPWSNLEVNMTTVDEIINAVYADINNTISDIEDMIANQFNAATAYSKGDYVIYQNGLYKFTSDHAAGAAWDSSIVSSIDVTAVIKQAESDLATLSRYFAAMSDTVSDLEDQVDMIQEAIETDKTVSGNPIVITDALPVPAKSLITEIEASQDLHGYDHPWAGGAEKNKFNPSIYSSYEQTDGSYSGMTNALSSLHYNIGDYVGTEITVSVQMKKNTDSTAGNIRLSAVINGTIVNGNNVNDFTYNQASVTITPETANDYIYINYGSNGSISFKDLQLEVGSTATSYAPYSNICPISGRTEVVLTDDGANKFDKTTVIDKTYISLANGTLITESYTGWVTSQPIAITGGSVKFSGNNNASADTVRYRTLNSSGTVLRYGGFPANTESGTLTAETGEVSIQFCIRTDSIDTFSVITESTTVTIQLGQTVYGARINFKTGEGIVDRAIQDLGELIWTYSSYYGFYTTFNGKNAKAPVNNNTVANIISSVYKASTFNDVEAHTGNGKIALGTSGNNILILINNDSYNDAATFKTAMSGQTICYELATPQTIQLTPEQLQMLKGYNRVTIDNGAITLTYRANKADSVQAEVDALDANKTDNSIVGTVENGTKASKAYAVGEHFIRNKKFCTAIASIASGAAFTLNTNYVEGTIADIISKKTININASSITATDASDFLKKLFKWLYENGYKNEMSYSGYVQWSGHESYRYSYSCIGARRFYFIINTTDDAYFGQYDANTETLSARVITSTALS